MGTSIRVSSAGEITTTQRCTHEEHLKIIEWGSIAVKFLPDEPAPEAPLPDCKNQQWTRVSGHTVCRCGKPYSEHIGLHLLCNGDLVKL